MKYLVIEIQKNSDGTVAVPPIASYDSFFDALSRYHTILAAAAISDVPVHTALILNEVGQEVRLDSYNKADGQVE
jgi:hypothetical protein